MVFTGFCTFVCVVVWRKSEGEGEIGGGEERELQCMVVAICITEKNKPLLYVELHR
jgi:hypothetical protein